MLDAKEVVKLSNAANKGENFKEDFDRFVDLMEKEVIRRASKGYYNAKMIYKNSDEVIEEKFYKVDISEFADLGQAERYVDKMFLQVRNLLDDSNYDRTFQSKVIKTNEGFVCEYELTVDWKDLRNLNDIIS